MMNKMPVVVSPQDSQWASDCCIYFIFPHTQGLWLFQGEMELGRRSHPVGLLEETHNRLLSSIDLGYCTVVGFSLFNQPRLIDY